MLKLSIIFAIIIMLDIIRYVVIWHLSAGYLCRFTVCSKCRFAIYVKCFLHNNVRIVSVALSFKHSLYIYEHNVFTAMQ